MKKKVKELPKKLVCSTCGEVTPVEKVFGVRLCPTCNVILDGGKFSSNTVG